MKKIFTFLAFTLLSVLSFGQALSFSQVGSDPAYCRLYGYQSGNGVVYADATGGTPTYTYQWTNLSTGQTTSNTAWGGLNPGDYEIKVWDSVGDSISQIVTLDSINPEAIIGVQSSGLGGSYNYYGGSAPVTVSFTNETVYPPPGPFSGGTNHFWQFTQFSNWISESNPDTTYTYTYEFAGIWSTKLIVFNKNGCTDTSAVYLYILGPLDQPENENIVGSLVANQGLNQLTVFIPNINSSQQLNIYSLSGKLIQQEQLIDETTNVPFHQKGIFVYEIVDPNKQAVIYTGKFSF